MFILIVDTFDFALLYFVLLFLHFSELLRTTVQTSSLGKNTQKLLLRNFAVQ